MTAATAQPAPRLTRKGQATRARILEAAAALIFKRGAASTSIEDVQRAAGVSASQLYHYFGDKQSLIRAVVDHQADAALAIHQPYLDGLDSIEALHVWRDAVVDRHRANQGAGGCRLGSLANELAETLPAARADLSAGFGRWEALMAQGLRTMHERGELPEDADPDDLATALLAALQGGLLLAKVRRDVRPLETALDAAIAHVEELAATTR